MPHTERRADIGSTPDLRAILLQRMESGELELPILPEAAASVLEACRDEDAGPRQVADTLQRDAALAGHVLRVANSAAYAAADPIVSLSQAVSRLGLAVVAEITMAVVLKARVFRPGRYEPLIHPVWPHSAAAGGWAREIARLGRRNVEGAFLCGLLHDVGRPVIVQAAVDTERALARRFEEHEIVEAMDELHAPLGATLIRRWELPERMASAILWHHDPQAATEHLDDVRTTALADRLAHWLLDEDSAEPQLLHGLPLVAALGIYPDELDELLERAGTVRQLAEAFA
jgi:putative nucleotidyltransferase with HDIG domain